MSGVNAPVSKYDNAKKELMAYFGCKDDFFVKRIEADKWTVKGEDGFFILTYWSKDNIKTDAVVVKKDGEPMVYKAKGYTMVVAIDCVKIGFIFENNKEL